MSTIIASNVSDGTLSIPTTFVTNGSAKAWVNFDGTGTIAVRDSFNVSSLTDEATGNYTVNLTNSFSASDYTINITGDGSTAAIFAAARVDVTTSSAARAVTAVTTSGSTADSALVSVSCLGDLA